MKKTKGMSKIVIIIIIALVAAAAVIGAKYFGKPATYIIAGPIEQAKPAIDRATEVKDTMNRTTEAARQAVEKANKAIDESR